MRTSHWSPIHITISTLACGKIRNPNSWIRHCRKDRCFFYLKGIRITTRAAIKVLASTRADIIRITRRFSSRIKCSNTQINHHTLPDIDHRSIFITCCKYGNTSINHPIRITALWIKYSNPSFWSTTERPFFIRCKTRSTHQWIDTSRSCRPTTLKNNSPIICCILNGFSFDSVQKKPFPLKSGKTLFFHTSLEFHPSAIPRIPIIIIICSNYSSHVGRMSCISCLRRMKYDHSLQTKL